MLQSSLEETNPAHTETRGYLAQSILGKCNAMLSKALVKKKVMPKPHILCDANFLFNEQSPDACPYSSSISR